MMNRIVVLYNFTSKRATISPFYTVGIFHDLLILNIANMIERYDFRIIKINKQITS